MATKRWLLSGMAALLLVACGGPADGDAAADPNGATSPTDEEVDDNVTDDRDPERDPSGEGSQNEPQNPFADFDRDEARERAQSHLGLAEDDVEQSETVRVVRRGDEQLPVTMDLRPGRLNLELDDDGSGYTVTRVVVEVPDEEDELVVE